MINQSLVKYMRSDQERAKVWMLSAVVLIGWATPLLGIWLYYELATPMDPYWPILVVAGVFGLPLLWAARLVKSPTLWFVSGALFGTILMSPWIPFSKRHLFFVKALTVHEGMTLPQVRQTMRGFQEERDTAELPYDEAYYYGWDLEGDSDMDCMSVDFAHGQVARVSIGSE